MTMLVGNFAFSLDRLIGPEEGRFFFSRRASWAWLAFSSEGVTGKVSEILLLQVESETSCVVGYL